MPNADDACTHCDLTYGDMRTGLSYSDIYMMLWSFRSDSSTWKYKRRHTVLGLWRSIKIDMWKHHLKSCSYEHEQYAEIEYLETSTEPSDQILW